MAKRKRLSPVDPTNIPGRAPEIKSMSPSGSHRNPPIADMAGVASTQAALDEVTETLRNARELGRLVQPILLEQVDKNYLVRDRIGLDQVELESLKQSLVRRGQQTPIEVVELEQGRFGLISGWRRFCAIEALFQETGEPRFATILAVLRQPETAADAYLAMVEENEIRASLSFYERARIVAQAVEQGVYPDQKSALKNLFRAIPRARRSKIKAFLPIVEALDDMLHHPSALTERLGLRLSSALRQDPDLAQMLRMALAELSSPTRMQEIAQIEAILHQQSRTGKEEKPNPEKWEISPHLQVVLGKDGELVLKGKAVNPDFRERLVNWLRTNKQM